MIKRTGRGRDGKD